MSERSIYGLFDGMGSQAPIHTWEADLMSAEGPYVSLYNKRNPEDSVASVRVALITLKEGQHVARLDCVRGNDNLPSQSRLGPVLRK